MSRKMFLSTSSLTKFHTRIIKLVMAQFEIATTKDTKSHEGNAHKLKDLRDPSCPLWFMLFSFIVKHCHPLPGRKVMSHTCGLRRGVMKISRSATSVELESDSTHFSARRLSVR